MRRAAPMFSSLLLLAGLSQTAIAQADFAEDFNTNGATGADGPANLVNRGWIFRNQCNPAVGAAWYDGDAFGGEAFEGAGYLAASSNATDFFGGDFSVWAILPAIPGQAPGDVFTAWVFGGGSATYDTFLEVRYAPSGSSTGSGPDDVGDFTQVLWSAEMPIATQGYQRITADVPGAGRIALRYRADFMMSFAGRGAYLSLDTLTVGPEQASPCGVPIRDVGETVVWDAPGSPYVICQDLLIPEGASVEIDPGVEVSFDPGATLRVEGELVALGTPASPVVFSGSPSPSDGLDVSHTGRATISNADLNVRLFTGGEHSSVVMTDSIIGTGGAIEGVTDLVVLERCQFIGGTLGGFSGLAGSIRVVDCEFSGGSEPHVVGLVHVDNVTVDGATLDIGSESVASNVLVDNVSVVGASGPGLRLTGPNYLIGQNVTLQSNAYPVALESAGLLWGSTLPTSGNSINAVDVPTLSLGFHREWAHTGVDYHVQGGFPQIYGGSLKIEPGATVKFGPDAGAFLILNARMILEGTRSEPIRLESLVPFQKWFGLKWVDDFDAKATHTIFDGGQITVQSDGGEMTLYDCTVQNSLEGTASVTGGIVRLFNSKIINNITGMVTTTSGRIEADGTNSPNIFDGNVPAIEYNNTSSLPFVRYNWWGDPTGPNSIFTPDALGDRVDGVHPAAFTPYLGAPPPQDDDFPVVKMMPTYFLADVGDTIILRWTSTDDHQVVEHRVEFADHDFPNEFETVAVLPGDATSYEFTAPIIAPNNLYTTPSAIRIVAVDDAGQESWDKSVLRIPYQEDWTVVPQLVTSPGPVHPHDNIDVCWSPGGLGDAYVLLDGTRMSRSAGGSNTGCLPIGAGVPYTSTDTARLLIITSFGAGGRIHYSFSDYFSIRPDPRFGDAPPSVTVTSPAAGQQFTGGGTIPVRWTASDDESMRSFEIQASYNAGRTWHTVATDLPGTARALDWDLPASAGIADVRVRVIGFDHRFQDASGTTGAFEILAGDSGGCPADFDGDGNLDGIDVGLFLQAYGTQDPTADINSDGSIDGIDVGLFLQAYGTGCGQ